MIGSILDHLFGKPAIVEEADRLEKAETLEIQTVVLSFDKNGVASMAIPKGFGPTFDPYERYPEEFHPFIPRSYLNGSFVHNPKGLDADAPDAQGSLKDNPEERKHGRT